MASTVKSVTSRCTRGRGLESRRGSFPLDQTAFLGPHRAVLSTRGAMEGKAKFIFPVVITAIVVFAASAAVTWSNIGFTADFVPRWLTAFVIGWPIAAVTAYFAVPLASKLTLGLVALIEGHA